MALPSSAKDQKSYKTKRLNYQLHLHSLHNSHDDAYDAVKNALIDLLFLSEMKGGPK